MSVATELIEAALGAADPRRSVANAMRPTARAHVLAIGKAAGSMYRGARDVLGRDIVGALVVAKHDEELDVEVVCGDHPIPGAASARAAHRVIEFVDALTSTDHLIVLLSGGASALLAAPVEGISLADLGQLTRELMHAGASIEELNTVRRELDVLKGGGLAARCAGSVDTYVLSDVLGDPLEAIGSGPTAPNPTSRADAEAVLRRYGLVVALPEAVHVVVPEVRHVVVANCATAVHAAAQRARALGLHTQIVTTRLIGEARRAGARFAGALNAYDGARPACLVAGGETTVTVRGAGRGGRNLEFALAAVEPLARNDSVSLTTFATDGEDGPTDAAGALVDGDTFDRGVELGLDPSAFLDTNNAYGYFDTLGALLKTGPTGTNVNDIVFGLLGVE